MCTYAEAWDQPSHVPWLLWVRVSHCPNPCQSGKAGIWMSPREPLPSPSSVQVSQVQGTTRGFESGFWGNWSRPLCWSSRTFQAETWPSLLACIINENITGSWFIFFWGSLLWWYWCVLTLMLTLGFCLLGPPRQKHSIFLVTNAHFCETDNVVAMLM